MAPQIVFYMVPKDEAAFLTFLESTGDVSYVPHDWAPKDSPYLSRPPRRNSRRFWWTVHLVSQKNSGHFEVALNERGRAFVSVFDTAAIQFTRSALRKGRLSDGRLYCVLFGDEIENQQVVTWFSILRHWLRRRYIHMEGRDEQGHIIGQGWIGPETLNWINGGGHLTYNGRVWTPQPAKQRS